MYVSECCRVDAPCIVVDPASDHLSGATHLSDPWNDRTRLADLLDLHDGRLGIPLLDDAGVREVLRSARRIAIDGGLKVVMDRCTSIEVHKMGRAGGAGAS